MFPSDWIEENIVTVRSSLLRSIGGAVDVPSAKHFPRGGEVQDEALWPSLPEVRAKWDEVHAASMSRLETLTAARVAEITEAPGLDKALLGTLGLAALHDSYHVGQLAAARRLYGLERIVG